MSEGLSNESNLNLDAEVTLQRTHSGPSADGSISVSRSIPRQRGPRPRPPSAEQIADAQERYQQAVAESRVIPQAEWVPASLVPRGIPAHVVLSPDYYESSTRRSVTNFDPYRWSAW
jgi:hypothetical protein